MDGEGMKPKTKQNKKHKKNPTTTTKNIKMKLNNFLMKKNWLHRQ
jgi:hypothetical protein